MRLLPLKYDPCYGAVPSRMDHTYTSSPDMKRSILVGFYTTWIEEHHRECYMPFNMRLLVVTSNYGQTTFVSVPTWVQPPDVPMSNSCSILRASAVVRRRMEISRRFPANYFWYAITTRILHHFPDFSWSSSRNSHIPMSSINTSRFNRHHGFGFVRRSRACIGTP